MPPHDQSSTAAIALRMTAAVAGSHRRLEDAEALHAEGRQARAQARSLRAESNAILDSAAAIASKELAEQRIALAEPVSARFQTDGAGNTGIELTVKLEDPSRAGAAREAIMERFGGESACDSLIVS